MLFTIFFIVISHNLKFYIHVFSYFLISSQIQLCPLSLYDCVYEIISLQHSVYFCHEKKTASRIFLDLRQKVVIKESIFFADNR